MIIRRFYFATLNRHERGQFRSEGRGLRLSRRTCASSSTRDFFATTRLGAYYYVLSSLGMLTAATAVEAWGKRPRKAAGEATVAMPAAPLLQ